MTSVKGVPDCSACSRASSVAASPDARTTRPPSASTVVTIARLAGPVGAMTRTALPRNSLSRIERLRFSPLSWCGRRMLNVLPLPFSLTALSEPPNSRMMRAEIDRPRPVPALLSLALPACSNSPKMRACSSAVMPAPVSSTVITRWRPSRAAVTSTPPAWVNFTALPMTLNSTCRSRAGSKFRTSGISGETAEAISISFSWARCDNISTTPSIRWRTDSARGCRWKRPTSMVEKSSRSCTSCDSAWPDSRMPFK